MQEIKIVNYNENWSEAFETEKNNIFALFEGEAAAVEHVGSTSIPGQAAKPIIDIFVGVNSLQPLAFYESKFDSDCYRYVPTGMNGRYLFAKYTDGTWTHNIHILPFDDGFYARNEFLLRDYLREHPDLVREYGEMKRRSAQYDGMTMEQYTRSKTEFIQAVVDAARTEKGLPLQNVWED
ncbi:MULTISPECIES: GrpB family protein [unclassified Paenibacillus]|uniref:GrpB family protein n=1 Tax=unclassified Paenibacillus TaxID=185978 RepID=UPI001C118848|nr:MULTISPECIES: GrpB family protein [unclassified Paenibacillus]MBU5443103.1 GrpB family protein [Paenibacillus sp. MSJ-34]CAH0122276.1 hypothetical protein PAE9249_04824 [Paenibacillus sp. CECT 9249]